MRFSIIILMLFGGAVPVVIITTYFWVFSNGGSGLSSRPEDWSAFGAVLAGAFTLLSAISTTLALVFVSVQTGLARKTAARQIESLTLEQYISHRKVFSERLEAVERHFEGRISFLALDELYGRVFPKNNPVHFEARVDTSNDNSGRLAHLIKVYEALYDAAVDIREGKTGQVHKFLQRFLSFQDALGIIVKEVEPIGVVRHRKFDKALNIFSLMESLKRAEYVLNSYLFYSANKTVGRFRALDVGELVFWVMYELMHEGGKAIIVELGDEGATDRFRGHRFRVDRFRKFLIMYKICIEGGKKVSGGSGGVSASYIYGEALDCLRRILSTWSLLKEGVLDLWGPWLVDFEKYVKLGLDRDVAHNGEDEAESRRVKFEKILGSLKM
ncbi:TPA: hypothetical protein ACNFRY_003492 [Pseudomonas aeruginosa]|uniref:hypothetical protein n=1 Tax=Pseudomonas aeruginosa TaxID=287 RepID=UPI000ADC76C9|nr:hypothetical protein [Pseudomonas aeruginosa]MBI8948450.1 hypothetical protein [Pseudomonas aeruginosa]MBN5542379.1 hypothetical protein [Pseudomonas aeruginosa]MBV5801073.1 hypothetical protein [Pseudomonas aeruginosa]HCL4364109.1 hypothetical protein [Pseudomonas aeruginosa]HEJ1614809.1 hypothetical protein [Pseudomonas aeruginosa]